jgi:CelD/BcsL family acetyltransferase involved in cellulose biosynthesis
VLTVQRITTWVGLEGLKGEWEALCLRGGAQLPFQRWAWHAAWWANLSEASLWVRDELFLCALSTVEGRLVAVAPLMLTRRPAAGPICLRGLDFIGPDPNITELRGLVCDPEWEAAAHQELRHYLAAHASEWDWVHWRGLREGTEAHAALMALPGAQEVATLETWLLPLPATWEALKSSRPRNLKESLRKCYNSLHRDGHQVTLEVARTPPAVEAAVARFLTLHRARATQPGTVAHHDVFGSERAQAFLHDVCQRFAQRDEARIFELVIGGEVVASRIGFALGDTLYLYYSGFLPAWGAYSVMTTCVAEAIQYAIAQGFRTVNLSTGTDVSKTRWNPEAVRYGELVEVASSLRQRYAYPAYQEVRRVLTRPGLAAAARSMLGRRARPG